MKKIFFILAVTGFFSLSAFATPEIGKQAPTFELPGQDGKTYKLSDYKGKYVVLEWHNEGCPYVVKHYDTQNMQNLQKKYGDKDVVWFTIVSSAPGTQGHQTAESAAKLYKEKNLNSTAILLDPDGKVGHAYKAKVTPHMYVISPQGDLIYMGAIDDNSSSRKSTVAGATNYVAAALDNAMAGRPIDPNSTTAYGCTVKYK